MPTLRERFRGSLLGLAVGDALGGRFEAQSGDAIRARAPDAAALMDYPKDDIWYTDDTQMAIGVAEALLADGAIHEPRLCAAFVANYVPSRGYGRGARAVIEAMEEGRDYRAVAERYYPGGSFGNGAAMRVAPVGLFFHGDLGKVAEQARLSALPTHTHALGVEGARLLARAVALCVRAERLERAAFFADLLAACEAPTFRAKLERAAACATAADLAGLGNGIEALESVPTAIASFALAPDSYADTIANVIFLGGDTDTLAAMAGALSGAFLGVDAVPPRLLGLLENGPRGRDYLLRLADDLCEAASGGA
jgi:poly(ADP-ribose) glycohydrolase ARH3